MNKNLRYIKTKFTLQMYTVQYLRFEWSIKQFLVAHGTQVG
jgi:hypothetical protein